MLAPLIDSEHPPAPELYGESVAADILHTLVSNPGGVVEDGAVHHPRRERRVLRSRPAADRAGGDPGRVSDRQPAAGRRLRGGRADRARVPGAAADRLARSAGAASSATDTFDHTSLLRFLETRFGAEVPNLSSWRRSVTGDLTSAFNFVKVDASVPSLPQAVARGHRGSR